MKVKKAIIPVAGFGTRLLPATKAIPKEMMPVVDKPLIQYVVKECTDAGIKQIVLITHSSKMAIENHFDKSYELESTLEKRVQRQLLEEIQSICDKDLSIIHIRQNETRGLAHAINCARPILDGEPFTVVLPDVIINQYTFDAKTQNLAQMLKIFDETSISQIMVEEIPMDKVESYGIVDPALEISKPLTPGMSFPIKNLVEKPKPQDAPSNLAVVGRYVLSGDIWPLFSQTPLGVGNEIQLTDTLKLLLKQSQINAYNIHGKTIDCGSKLGLAIANLEYGTKDPRFGNELKEFIKELVAND